MTLSTPILQRRIPALRERGRDTLRTLWFIRNTRDLTLRRMVRSMIQADIKAMRGA